MSTPEDSAATAGSETREAPRLKLGSRLKAAREARGMSAQDVAQRLRLDLRIIQALEADDLERLPALTFVRGYLRNYARLVGLDESMVTEALPDTSAATAGITLKRSAGSRKAMTGPRFPLWRWLRNLLLLGLLAALIINGYPWALRIWEARQQPESTGPEQGSRLSLPGQESSPAEQVPLPEGEAVLPLPALDETAPQPSLEELLSPAEIPPAEVPPAEIPAAEIPAAEVPAGTDARVSAPEPEPLPVPSPELVLGFDEDSWVEVTDGDQQRLLFGLMHQGERKVLSGHPPFTLLLGNAPGVTLEYAGERVDIRAHTRGKVARFTLP